MRQKSQAKPKTAGRNLDFPQSAFFLNYQQLFSSKVLALNFFHNIEDIEEKKSSSNILFFNLQVVVDICAYRSPAMMDCMFVKRLQTAQSDPDYAALFHGRPRRFVLPLKPRPGAENQVGFIAAYLVSDADYAALFHGRPRRFVLPLKPRTGAENQVGLIAAYGLSS
jgi:hypothetical protein